jgi:nitrate reductase NapE component
MLRSPARPVKSSSLGGKSKSFKAMSAASSRKHFSVVCIGGNVSNFCVFRYVQDMSHMSKKDRKKCQDLDLVTNPDGFNHNLVLSLEKKNDDTFAEENGLVAICSILNVGTNEVSINQDGYLNRGFFFDNGRTEMPSPKEVCFEKAKKIVGEGDCVILCLSVCLFVCLSVCMCCLINVCVWMSLTLFGVYVF